LHKINTCLLALNLAEAAGDALDGVDLVKIYIAYAIELQRQNNPFAQILARMYWNKGARAARACGARAATYSWVFSREGEEYFNKNAWINQQLVLHDGSVLHAGSYLHLSLAYRRHMLSSVLHGYVSGADTMLLQHNAQTLLQHSLVATVR
jgi:hypothetical protein